mgnify:FL=1
MIPKYRERRIDHLKHGYAEVGFFGTGASAKAHFDLLTKLMPDFKTLIDSGRIRLTVYTWTNENLAREIYRQARALNLRVSLNDDDVFEGNWQVKIIFGKSPGQAIEKSIQAAADVDYLISMMNERTGWMGVMPISPLKPINLNARGNYRWALRKGYIDSVWGTQHLADFLKVQLTREKSKDILERMEKLFNVKATLINP